MRVAFFPHFTQEFHREKGFGVDRHKLPIPVVARYIRFHPTKHKFLVHLRVEVYGIFKGELITSKHDKWIVKCYTDVSRVKVNATTPKVLWGVFRSWFLDFKKFEKKFTVRKRQCGFDEFTCLFHLLKFLDYRILRLPFEIVACTFILFSHKFSRKSCMNS